MQTYQLTKTARSFTIGGLTRSIGSTKLRKNGNNIIIGSDDDAFTISYTQLLGIASETFSTVDEAVTYLEAQVFKVGGGDGNGVTARKTALAIESDFNSAISPFAQGLTGSALASGSLVAKNSDANHPGIVVFRDSSTVNGGYEIVSSSAALLIAGGEQLISVLRLTSSRTTIIFKLGFQATFGSADPSEACYFRYNGATGLINAVNRNANVETVSTASFTPVLNTWYAFVIAISSDSASVSYSIINSADTVVWEETITTNIPLTTIGYGVVAYETSADVAADMIELDYLRVEINRALVR